LLCLLCRNGGRSVTAFTFAGTEELKKQADMFVQVDVNGGGFRFLDLL
jgi:hypothetical protein